MRKILFLFCIHLNFIATAQIEVHIDGQIVNNEYVATNLPTNNSSSFFDFFLLNLSSDSIYFGHSRTRIMNESGWYDQIADPYLAWSLPDQDVWVSPINNVLIAPGDSAHYKVYIYPYEIEGCGIYHYNFREMNTDSSLAVFDFHFATYSNACFLDESIKDKTIVSVYPNPSSEVLNIDLPNSKDEASIIIHDYAGKVVLNKAISYRHTSISLQHLTPGVYLYTIESEERIIRQDKLIVQ